MAKYKIRFVDGPLMGQQSETDVLYYKISKWPEGGNRPTSYFRKDNPNDRLKEYRYSVKP